MVRPRRRPDILEAENKTEAKEAVKGFEEFNVQWPRAVAKVTNDEALLTSYDYPAEHEVHLRTTTR